MSHTKIKNIWNKISKGKGNKNDAQNSRMTDSSVATSDYCMTGSQTDRPNCVSSETSAPHDRVDLSLGAATVSSVNIFLNAENSNTETVNADGNSSGASGSASNTIPSPRGHGLLDTTPEPSGRATVAVDDLVQRSDSASNTVERSAQRAYSTSNTGKGSAQREHSTSNTVKDWVQRTYSTSNTFKDSAQSADSASNTAKASRHSTAVSASNTGKGSRQSADSASNTGKDSAQSAVSGSEKGEGSGQIVVSASEKGKGSGQIVVSASGKGEGSGQIVVSASEKGKGSEQIVVSALEKGEGSGQIVVSVSEEVEGQIVVSASKKGEGSGQTADSASEKGEGSGQTAGSALEKGEGFGQIVVSASEIDKGSGQIVVSALEKGEGSGQIVDSASEKGEGQSAVSASEKGEGSGQIVVSALEKGERSGQIIVSASEKGKGSGQIVVSALEKGEGHSAVSASEKGEGFGQIVDSASEKVEGQIVVSASEKGKGSGQTADSASEKGEGSGQTAGSAPNNLPEVKDSDSFGGVLKELWRDVKRRWRFYVIMSLTAGGTSLAAGIFGAMLTMTVHNWYIAGPQTTDTTVSEFQAMRMENASMRDQEIARIKDETELKLTNLRREMENVFNQTSDVVVKNISDIFNKTTQLDVAGEKTSVEIQRLQNTTALQSETLRNETRNLRAGFDYVTFLLRKRHKSQLEAATKALEQKYSSKFNEQMQKFSNSIAEISHTCEQRVEDTKKENHLKMQAMQEAVVQKLSNVDSRQDFMFTLIHQLGFMRLDTWGPVLLILGAFEFVLMFLMCRQGAKAGTAIFNRGANALANGQPQQANRPSRADWLRESGDRGDNRLCVVCFRKRDLPRVKEISETLVQGMRNAQRVHLETFVVDTRADILRIPACRAALVFVDPDERLMILEDRRLHMGGDRRDTVQELIDTDVDVTLVIYDDPTDGDVARDDLYHRRLSQVREHNLLKQLDQKKRVVSVKKGKPFADWQRNHIVKELDQTFK